MARIVFGVEVIAGMPFIDARALRKRDQVPDTLASAMYTLFVAGTGQDRLVRTEVRFVGAAREPKPRAASGPRAYVSPFTGHERWNGQLLAAHLLWAAVVLREQRLAKRAHLVFDEEAVQRQAKKEQRILVDHFPEAERWREYLVL